MKYQATPRSIIIIIMTTVIIKIIVMIIICDLKMTIIIIKGPLHKYVTLEGGWVPSKRDGVGGLSRTWRHA